MSLTQGASFEAETGSAPKASSSASNGHMLRELRRAAGISQEEASRLAEVAIPTWQAWERGHREIRLSRLRLFCRKLEHLIECRLQQVRDVLASVDRRE
jgi:transcriptional regulator with XRE-family HTH domain